MHARRTVSNFAESSYFCTSIITSTTISYSYHTHSILVTILITTIIQEINTMHIQTLQVFTTIS